MTSATWELERPTSDSAALRLAGSWLLASELPGVGRVLEGLGPDVRRVGFRCDGVDDWDSGLVAFALRVEALGLERGFETDATGLPPGVQRLLRLRAAVPARETGRDRRRRSRLARIGERAQAGFADLQRGLVFLGEAALSFGRLLSGRARFRRSDLLLAIQESGPEALGIVSLISFLVGLILSFMGAMQLRLFGAEVYVANLVALGMAREMAPMMTGIIMAGRTGAAYAAQLGTMTVNEEIDSLRTLGISPMDFLVLPRMLALVLMMPLLTIFSNLLGILGGYLVGTGVLGITPALYWTQTADSVGIDDFAIGLVKASVIGVLVAISGCMRGMQAGRSASAVGLATTSAVVTAIVAIIVNEAVFAVVLEVLGL